MLKFFGKASESPVSDLTESCGELNNVANQTKDLNQVGSELAENQVESNLAGNRAEDIDDTLGQNDAENPDSPQASSISVPTQNRPQEGMVQARSTKQTNFDTLGQADTRNPDFPQASSTSISAQNLPSTTPIQASSKDNHALFDTSTVSSISGESSISSSVLSTDYGIDDNSFLVKITVNSGQKGFLSDSTVSLSSGESAPFMLNQN